MSDPVTKEYTEDTMKDGFIRVAATTPDIHVADPQYNSEQIIELMEQGSARGVKVMAFPELCLTAYTCSDLFLQGAYGVGVLFWTQNNCKSR